MESSSSSSNYSTCSESSDSDDESILFDDSNESSEDSEAGANELSLGDLSCGQPMPYQFEPLRRRPEVSQNENETMAVAPNEDRMTNTDWCSCGQCERMPSLDECVCCRESEEVDELVERDCITQHGDIYETCLSVPALRVLYRELVTRRGRRPQEPLEGLIHKKYRYLAYRSFMRWIYFRLPKGERYPIPSCVVQKVRQAFPSDEYCGFRHYVARRRR